MQLNILRDDWILQRLGDFAISVKGKKPKNQSEVQTEVYIYPYVDIQGFEKNIFDSYTDGQNCAFCTEDDFLMVWDGSRSGLVGKAVNGAIGSTLVKINLPKIENRFAYYFLKSKYIELNTNAKGTGTPHVNPDLLWNYSFPIVPLLEQKAIVAKIEQLFSELDKGIESLKTAQAKLKIYRQAVLKKAFEGDYKLVEIGDVCDVFVGATPSRKNINYWDGDIYWVSSGEVKFNTINTTKEKITEEGLKNTSTVLHPPQTILLAMIGEGKTRGQCAILNIHAAHNQNTAALRAKKELLDFRFLYNFLVYTYEDTRRIGSGNNQKALNKARVSALTLPLPTIEEQIQIVQEIESRLSVCDNIEQTISEALLKAEALRQSILKKAFEGKLLDAKELEAIKNHPEYESAEKLLQRIKLERAE